MKKILFTILLIIVSVSTLTSCGSCSSSKPKYKDYNDFLRNGTQREHEQFYDWLSRNP